MRFIAAFTAVALITFATSAIAADVYTGTWTLNHDKSIGGAVSQVLTINVVGDRETYRSELLTRDGKRQVTNYSAAYDSKEHPSRTVITAADGSATTQDDTVILRKVDALTRERHWKHDGRVVRILRRVVSPDGRTLTSQIIDVDERGHEHPAGTLVFDKKTPGN